jgi:hypothetical protein
VDYVYKYPKLYRIGENEQSMLHNFGIREMDVVVWKPEGDNLLKRQISGSVDNIKINSIAI